MEIQHLSVFKTALMILFLNSQAKAIQLDPCLQPKVVGPCEALIGRYFFDQKLGKCQPFFYGGCQGNANNFETLSHCQRQCACSLPKNPGPCEAYIPRYFYNSKSGRCEQFIYGGCGGNENNFNTLMDCQRTCERI
ncbi:hypothetical protein CHS0354_037683 [Potamilus streckersoni]|uniref:BPTI/Kunitz inhibitor domain-containing protein n=1 Tax=Potamilus streckersoni TaxID=2493646 RepID=A0AAE0T0X7_9BIVA|nr:hypothetical protein CHS0354_037683 [Potamilus streckersoni]